MKYLIVSDIHGSKEASELVISLDFKYNFSKIIVLGDLNYNGARNIPPHDYSPLDVTRNFKLIKDKCIFIRGNCDSRVDEMVLESKFYDILKIKINKRKFILTHGDLYSPNNYKIKKNEVFMYGHTHIYEMNKSSGHYIINPGSLSLPKNNNDKTFIIYDDEKNEFYLYNNKNQLIQTLSI